ncbi:MAG: hypothetical protein M3R52_06110 [Acidobacteriota bacterium]|nr:hypothetical protein [Acidobacteriota bacterium]
MGEEKEKLLRLVNSSGFPFQLRIADQIRRPDDSSARWDLVAQEHPWRAIEEGRDGFIDIIIRNSENDRMVLECKRTRDADWVFLLPENGVSNSGPHARMLYVSKSGPSADQLRSGWHNFYAQPESTISEFCIVRGSGERHKPMLENLCDVLLNSIECLAQEESAIAIERKVDLNCLYVPVIVTNANLQVCRFKLGSVSLEDGEIPDGDFESVPYIRFFKSLSTKSISLASVGSMDAANRERQRTVFVVQSARLESFLGSWDMTNNQRPRN